jgi:hypothetical protein
MMTRRDALRLLATAAAIRTIPARARTALRSARVLLGQAAARTLNEQQARTVKALVDTILPRTETPSASETGAVEFIDLMLTEWYDDSERTRFLTGLADVDTRTESLFSKNFVDCSPLEQGEIVAWLGEKMTESSVGREEIFPENRPATSEDFYPMLRRLTLTAYFTSEVGATESLHFEIVPGRYDGCAPAEANPIQPERSQNSTPGSQPQ